MIRQFDNTFVYQIDSSMSKEMADWFLWPGQRALRRTFQQDLPSLGSTRDLPHTWWGQESIALPSISKQVGTPEPAPDTEWPLSPIVHAALTSPWLSSPPHFCCLVLSHGHLLPSQLQQVLNWYPYPCFCVPPFYPRGSYKNASLPTSHPWVLPFNYFHRVKFKVLHALALTITPSSSPTTGPLLPYTLPPINVMQPAVSSSYILVIMETPALMQ